MWWTEKCDWSCEWSMKKFRAEWRILKKKGFRFRGEDGIDIINAIERFIWKKRKKNKELSSKKVWGPWKQRMKILNKKSLKRGNGLEKLKLWCGEKYKEVSQFFKGNKYTESEK